MGLRYGELFAGAGGLSLGLHRAGWQCAFHAEIDPFARRILKKRFPDVPLFGDVAELRGAELVAQCGRIDLLSGGSPCQDLSQAGLRAGLISGERSNLFFQQVRLWKETGAPYLLWENVHGALSSPGRSKTTGEDLNGEDFRFVLSALVGADVGRAIDRKGRIIRWPSSGLVLGPDGVAAWRVLDAQYWGPPQRRRRVFVLAARSGFPSPEEVLFEWEGVLGYSSESKSEVEDPSSGSRSRAKKSRGPRSVRGPVRVLSFNAHSNGQDLSESRDYGIVPNLTAGDSGTGPAVVVAANVRAGTVDQVTAPLQANGNSLNSMPVVFDTKQSGETADGVAPTLRAMAHSKSHMNGGGQLGVVNYAVPIQNSATNRSGDNLTPTADAEGRVRIRPAGLGVGDVGDPMFTLTCGGPQHAVFHAAVAFDQAQITHPANRSRVEPGMSVPTLNASGKMHVARMLAFGHYIEDGTASALKARDYKDATDLVYNVYENPRHCSPLPGQTDSGETVSAVREETGAETVRSEAGGSGSVSSSEVLQSEVYGAELRSSSREGDCRLDGGASKSAEDLSAESLHAMRSKGPNGCAPLERGLDGQPSEESAEVVSGVSHQDSSFIVGAPRRLMPIETERLMNWPDDWTDVPDEDGTPASDSARYKACGNGVVSACVEWIGLQLKARLDAMPK